jgi:hypothetical protein
LEIYRTVLRVKVNPGNVNLGTFNDEIRRLEVSKTILLRNTRI